MGWYSVVERVYVCVWVSRKKNVVFDLKQRKSVKMLLGYEEEDRENWNLSWIHQIPVSFRQNVICKRNKNTYVIDDEGNANETTYIAPMAICHEIETITNQKKASNKWIVDAM